MNGVITVSGVAAVNHVAEEHKPDQDTYKEQQSMEAKHVREKQRNQEIVRKNPAQVNILKQ